MNGQTVGLLLKITIQLTVLLIAFPQYQKMHQADDQKYPNLEVSSAGKSIQLNSPLIQTGEQFITWFLTIFYTVT